VAEAGRVTHARGQCGAADVGQAGQRPGEAGGVHLLVVVLAVGGVGGEFGGDGVQQPDLGGDLGSQAGEVGGGVPVVEFQRCPGGIEPLAGAFGALVVAGGLDDQRGQPGQASPGQGTGVTLTVTRVPAIWAIPTVRAKVGADLSLIPSEPRDIRLRH
jgi:hypothetical protein